MKSRSDIEPYGLLLSTGEANVAAPPPIAPAPTAVATLSDSGRWGILGADTGRVFADPPCGVIKCRRDDALSAGESGR